MANDNLQRGDAPAIPKLALELEQLHLRVQRMERLLDGADSILSAIRYDNIENRRAQRMVEFLGAQVEQWREHERELDFPSDDVWHLMDKAQHGQLIRYGKPLPEPAE
jgi:hypothetical protein